jgi:hypothetical protein
MPPEEINRVSGPKVEDYLGRAHYHQRVAGATVRYIGNSFATARNLITYDWPEYSGKMITGMYVRGYLPGM